MLSHKPLPAVIKIPGMAGIIWMTVLAGNFKDCSHVGGHLSVFQNFDLAERWNITLHGMTWMTKTIATTNRQPTYHIQFSHITLVLISWPPWDQPLSWKYSLFSRHAGDHYFVSPLIPDVISILSSYSDPFPPFCLRRCSSRFHPDRGGFAIPDPHHWALKSITICFHQNIYRHAYRSGISFVGHGNANQIYPAGGAYFRVCKINLPINLQIIQIGNIYGDLAVFLKEIHLGRIHLRLCPKRWKICQIHDGATFCKIITFSNAQIGDVPDCIAEPGSGWRGFFLIFQLFDLVFGHSP